MEMVIKTRVLKLIHLGLTDEEKDELLTFLHVLSEVEVPEVDFVTLPDM